MTMADATPALNKWYVTSPQSEIHWNTFCHVGLKTIAVITCIAAVALAASVLVFAFLTASGTSMPIGLAVASFATFPLTHFASSLWNKSKKYLVIEQQERRVEQWLLFLSKAYLNEEGTLNFEKINNDLLFKEFGILATRETLIAIQQRLPMENASLQQASNAWLCVAARFMHELEITRKAMPEAPVLDKNSPTERERAILRKHNYKEMHIFQHTLSTEILATIIRFPFTQAAHLSDLGSLNIKSKILRADDRKRFHQDDYFIPKEKSVPPITVRGILKQIARKLTTAGLLSPQNSIPARHPIQQEEGLLENPDHLEFIGINREKFADNFAEDFERLAIQLFQHTVEVEEM